MGERVNGTSKAKEGEHQCRKIKPEPKDSFPWKKKKCRIMNPVQKKERKTAGSKSDTASWFGQLGHWKEHLEEVYRDEWAIAGFFPSGDFLARGADRWQKA